MQLINKRLQLGMTLVEILVVVAIIGALASITTPAVSNYLIKTERNRVQLDLYQLQVHVEKYYTENNNTYPDNRSLICSKCQVSDEYNFAIDTTGVGNNAYVIKATPKSTSIQNKDSDCYSMAINAVSKKLNFSNKSKPISDNSKCWV